MFAWLYLFVSYILDISAGIIFLFLELYLTEIPVEELERFFSDKLPRAIYLQIFSLYHNFWIVHITIFLNFYFFWIPQYYSISYYPNYFFIGNLLFFSGYFQDFLYLWCSTVKINLGIYFLFKLGMHCVSWICQFLIFMYSEKYCNYIFWNMQHRYQPRQGSRERQRW